MTVKELINALKSYKCDNSEVIGFLPNNGDFKLKSIKYIQDNGEPFIVITSEDFDPFAKKSSYTDCIATPREPTISK